MESRYEEVAMRPFSVRWPRFSALVDVKDRKDGAVYELIAHCNEASEEMVLFMDEAIKDAQTFDSMGEFVYGNEPIRRWAEAIRASDFEQRVRRELIEDYGLEEHELDEDHSHPDDEGESGIV